MAMSRCTSRRDTRLLVKHPSIGSRSSMSRLALWPHREDRILDIEAASVNPWTGSADSTYHWP